MHSNEGMFLLQQQYVVNLLNNEGLGNLKPTSMPMEPRIDLSLSIAPPLNHLDTTRYRRILGSLQYLTTTWSDISLAVSKLSQFFSNPTKCHWQALQRILRYVSGNPFSGILLRPTTSAKVTVFSDADYAGDALDKRSHRGFVVSYGAYLVS